MYSFLLKDIWVYWKWQDSIHQITILRNCYLILNHYSIVCRQDYNFYDVYLLCNDLFESPTWSLIACYHDDSIYEIIKTAGHKLVAWNFETLYLLVRIESSIRGQFSLHKIFSISLSKCHFQVDSLHDSFLYLG